MPTASPLHARELAFEAQTDGTDIELVFVNRTTRRQWWCGPETLLSWVRVDVIDETGNVLASAAPPSRPATQTADGYTWSVAPGDTLWIGTVAIETGGPGHVRAKLADGRTLEVAKGAHLQLSADPATGTPSDHADCLRRARARWYAASEFRADLPWGPPDTPPHRVFPVRVEGFEEIGPPSISSGKYSFRFRDKGREGIMR
jgi:hypothetical protein